MKSFVTAIVMSLVMFCSISLADYNDDYKRASKEGKTWVIIVSDPANCSHCRKLERDFKQLKALTLPIKRVGGINWDDVIVTKLHPSDPIAQAMSKNYVANKGRPITGIPDWVIYKYKDGKFKYHKRILGYLPKDKIIKALKGD